MKVNISTDEVEYVTSDGSSIWVPILEFDYDQFRDIEETIIDDSCYV